MQIECGHETEQRVPAGLSQLFDNVWQQGASVGHEWSTAERKRPRACRGLFSVRNKGGLACVLSQGVSQTMMEVQVPVPQGLNQYPQGACRVHCVLKYVRCIGRSNIAAAIGIGCRECRGTKRPTRGHHVQQYRRSVSRGNGTGEISVADKRH